MSNTYNADAIEVLSGLDPVRKRPGMYTDTTRPNHMVQEVIDNSVDEALAGHAKTLTLTLNKDGSVDVYFGPTAPPGKANNWVQTIPGKGWFMILRLYGPLEPWFNKTWRPGEIELQP